MSPLRVALALAAGLSALAATAAADPVVVTPTVVASPAAPAPAAVDPPVAAPAAEAVTPQRHKLALAANTQGLRFYRTQQLPRAAMRFRDATLLDPSYALAHYNLACMASRLRDIDTVVTELAWLSRSNDPIAAAKLEKARSDS